jgi:outer membrane protein, multidrug efflux system
MRAVRTSRAVWLAALAALGTAGCRLDPNGRVPGVVAESTWREGSPDPQSLANVGWFEVYRDPVLHDLVREALRANPDLAVALARVEEARAIAVATGADLYPRLDLGAAAGGVKSSRLDVPFGDRTHASYALSFDMLWEVDVFGRVRSQASAAKATYFASVEGHRDVAIRLVADVARAYFELRELDELLEITTRTLQASQEYVDLARIRFEGHKTSEVDLRQAESEYYRTAAVHVDVQRRIRAKENELSVLVGHQPGAVPRGTRATEQALPDLVPAGLPSDLLQRRPDILVAEQALAAETALVGAARANLYPRIALTGSFGWASDSLSDLFTDGANSASLIAGLLQPLFNAGRNQALVQAQAARMRAAMEQYRRVVLAAFAEVESALVSYRRFSEQRGVGERRLEALRKVLELAEVRYVGGKTEYLEVLDAQRALFDAELEQADTIQAQLVSLTALYKALGGGWDPSTAPPVCGTRSPLPVCPTPARPSVIGGAAAPVPAPAYPSPPPAARTQMSGGPVSGARRASVQDGLPPPVVRPWTPPPKTP